MASFTPGCRSRNELDMVGRANGSAVEDDAGGIMTSTVSPNSPLDEKMSERRFLRLLVRL